MAWAALRIAELTGKRRLERRCFPATSCFHSFHSTLLRSLMAALLRVREQTNVGPPIQQVGAETLLNSGFSLAPTHTQPHFALPSSSSYSNPALFMRLCPCRCVEVISCPLYMFVLAFGIYVICIHRRRMYTRR